jgi:hypothetical protein
VRARCAAPAALPEFKTPDAFGVQYGLGVVVGFGSGKIGDISCPAGMLTMLIAGAALCQRAAAVAGRPYGGNVTADAMPRGCVWSSTGGSFFLNNIDEYGYDGPSSAQPVCAGAPCFRTGATINRGQSICECA